MYSDLATDQALLSQRTLRQLGIACKISREPPPSSSSVKGIPTRWRKNINTERTIQLYESGLSLDAASDHLGVDASTILNHFKRLRIDRRQVGTNRWRWVARV